MLKFLKLVLTLVVISLIVPFCLHAKTCKVSILHFNDTHGHLEPNNDNLGGAARIASLIEKIKKENTRNGRHTLVLHGGDVISGTMVSFNFKGKAEMDFLNQIGVEAMAVGNHEFDFGQDNLINMDQQSNFPFLSANIIDKRNGKPFFQAYKIVKYDDGCTISVIGATTEDTPTMAFPKNVSNMEFIDSAAAIKSNMNELNKLSDLQIALTHLGVRRDIRLAKMVPDIDAVIGGHDHVPISDYSRIINETPVCQTPANGTYLGRVDLTFNDGAVTTDRVEAIEINKKAGNSRKTKRLLSKYFKELKTFKKEKVGILAHDLPHGRNGLQTPMGKYVTKVLCEKTGADVGFLNSGGIRSYLKAGVVTQNDIYQVFPFGNHVTTVAIKGNELIELVEAGLERVKRGRTVYNWSNLEYKENGKTIEVFVDNKPVNPHLTYVLATTDFMAYGGDGATVFKGKKLNVTETTLRSAVAEDIKRNSK